MTKNTAFDAGVTALLDAHDTGRSQAIREAQAMLRDLAGRCQAESMRVALEEGAKAIEHIGWDRHRVAAEVKKLDMVADGS